MGASSSKLPTTYERNAAPEIARHTARVAYNTYSWTENLIAGRTVFSHGSECKNKRDERGTGLVASPLDALPSHRLLVSARPELQTKRDENVPNLGFA